MPHIFFERLEQRRSTQSLLGVSGFFDEFPVATPFYGVNIPIDDYTNPRYPIISYPWTQPWEISLNWNYPWSSPLSWLSPWPVMSPWSPPIFSPMPRLSPWPSPSSSSLWDNLRDLFPWTTVLYPKPIDQEPDITNVWCYALGPPRERNSASYPLSKLEDVRKSLLAHFREKGVISKENSLKILSSTFRRA